MKMFPQDIFDIFNRIHPEHDDWRTNGSAGDPGCWSGLRFGNLDQNVDFLFGEQLIQDERILELEQTSDDVAVEVAEINVDVLGKNKHELTLHAGEKARKRGIHHNFQTQADITKNSKQEHQ